MLLNICCQAFMAHYMGVVTWAWSYGRGQLWAWHDGRGPLGIDFVFLGNIYVLYFCESMPWRGRMDPTQNLFWNYMFLKNLK